MIALLPIAVEQCVNAASPAAKRAMAVAHVTGDPASVNVVLAKVQAAKWQVVADEILNGRRRIAVKYGPDASFRDIAGFIHSVQQAGLTMTGSFSPPICGTQEQ